MAREIVINFKINETGESVQQVIKNAKEMKEAIKQLQSQMDETEFGTEEYNALADSLKSVNDQYSKLTKTTQETSESFTSLGKQIREAKAELDKFKPGTKEYADAADKLRTLKDRMNDVGDATKISGSGFERIQKSFGLLRESIGTADFGKAKIAFSGLGAAMKALPIFLIIEGVKLLIEGFDKFKNSTGVLGTALRAIGDAFEWVSDKISEFTDWIGLTNNKLEEQTKKTLDAAKEQRAALEGRYDREIELAKAAGKDVTELEKKKAQAALDALKVELDGIIALRKARGEYTEEEIKRIKEISEEAKNIRNKARATEIAEEKKHNDKKKELDKEYAKGRKTVDDDIAAYERRFLNDSYKSKFKILEEESAKRIETAKKNHATEEQLSKIRVQNDIARKELYREYSNYKINILKEEADIIEKANSSVVDNEERQALELMKIANKLQQDKEELNIKNTELEINSTNYSAKKKAQIEKEYLREKAQLEVDSLNNTQAVAEKEADIKLKALQDQLDEEQKKTNDQIEKLAKQKFKINEGAVDEAAKKQNRINKEFNETIDAQIRLAKKESEIKQNSLKTSIQIAEEEKNALVQNREIIAAKTVQIEEKLSKDIEEIEKARKKKIMSEVIQIVNGVASVASAIVGLFSEIEKGEQQKRDEELNKLNEQLDKKLDLIESKREEDLAKSQEYYDQQIEMNKASLDAQLENTNLTEEEKKKLQETANATEKQLKIEAANEALKIKYEADQAEYEANIAKYEQEEKLKEEAFENAKKLQIAQVIINTITGAIAAFQSLAPIPYVGTILGAVAAAAVAAMGATAVANISSTKYQKGQAPKAPKPPRYQVGGGASSSLGGATGSATPKDSTLFSTSGGSKPPVQPEKPQTVKLEQDQPLKAYVVASDIADALDKEAALKRKVTGF